MHDAGASLAGVSAVAAGIVFVISGACLAVFFSTDIEAWGRANDATIALFAVLMIPVVVDLHGQVFGVATMLGVAGLLVIAVTSGLTAMAKLDWLLSGKIGGAGFGGFLAWITALCVAILRDGGLPAGLAWFGLVTVAILGVMLVLALRFVRTHGSFTEGVEPPVGMWIAFAAAFLCVPVWTLWLGVSL